jgi:voltage-gated potassium channel
MPNTSRAQLSFLLIGLLVFLLIAPVINEITTSSLVNEIAFLGMIVVGVWSLVENRRAFVTGVSLAIVSLIISVINLSLDNSTLRIFNSIAILLFCFLSISIVASKVLLSKSINANTLIGSACVYLLLGVIWALLYSIIEFILPGSFHGISAVNNSSYLWEFVYYSFVTITTLGYGDIYPLIPLTRSLAYLEAVCGQLYMALLVATLVGRFLSGQQK